MTDNLEVLYISVHLPTQERCMVFNNFNLQTTIIVFSIKTDEFYGFLHTSRHCVSETFTNFSFKTQNTFSQIITINTHHIKRVNT